MMAGQIYFSGIFVIVFGPKKCVRNRANILYLQQLNLKTCLVLGCYGKVSWRKMNTAKGIDVGILSD